MLAEHITQEPLEENSTGIRGIRIDPVKREVTIDGVVVPLRGQSYDLLKILYLHQNELCSREMLIEQLFGERFDESNQSQVSRLNTAIRRLREKIEDDPDHPRFVITAPLGGYTFEQRLDSTFV